MKLVSELDRLLPLAQAGVTGSLTPVRVAFITGITNNLKASISWFTKVCQL